MVDVAEKQEGLNIFGYIIDEMIIVEKEKDKAEKRL